MFWSSVTHFEPQGAGRKRGRAVAVTAGREAVVRAFGGRCICNRLAAGGLPSNVAATAAAVQWLPLVHSGGQLLALPALPTAAAGSAAAAADAQAERARDAVCAGFHVAK